MITLAIDTSTTRGSVALLRDAGALGEETFTRARDGDGLFEAMATLFQRSGLPVTAVELIGVGTGPGSFTGIRAGIAAARGVALPSKLPIKSVSSFDALALTAMPQIPSTAIVLCVLGDARREEVYSAMYARSGETLRRCGISTLENAQHVANGLGSVWFVSAEDFPETTRLFPSAVALGCLAHQKFLTDGQRSDEQIEPLYLREPAYRKSAPSTVVGAADILMP